jgi:3-isopropylmalate/(R)-2-methylmalate dehydratase small subunit
MKAFSRHSDLAVGLDLANVDTDQVIPVRFLTRAREEGFGDALFSNLRQPTAGGPPLVDLAAWAGATVLVTGRNFGCGSSREQAVWALLDFGFRCIIAPSFGELFSNNAGNNGLLLVRLGDGAVVELLGLIRRRPRVEIVIDLAGQVVVHPSGRRLTFEIDPFWKHALLHGKTELQMTLDLTREIDRFEATHRQRMSWLFPTEPA